MCCKPCCRLRGAHARGAHACVMLRSAAASCGSCCQGNTNHHMHLPIRGTKENLLRQPPALAKVSPPFVRPWAQFNHHADWARLCAGKGRPGRPQLFSKLSAKQHAWYLEASGKPTTTPWSAAFRHASRPVRGHASLAEGQCCGWIEGPVNLEAHRASTHVHGAEAVSVPCGTH